MPHPAPLLLGSFFSVAASTATPGRLQAQLHLNAHHAVFSGHFPGQPVVPGVCVLAMVKDVLAQHLGKELLLRHCGHVKFVHPVNPLAMPELDLTVDYSVRPYLLNFQVSLRHHEQALCRVAGSFQTDFL